MRMIAISLPEKAGLRLRPQHAAVAHPDLGAKVPAVDANVGVGPAISASGAAGVQNRRCHCVHSDFGSVCDLFGAVCDDKSQSRSL